MNKYWQLAIGAFAAGMTQFGILVAAGLTDPLPLTAGVVGTVGTTIAGMLKQLPRKEWSEDERGKP